MIDFIRKIAAGALEVVKAPIRSLMEKEPTRVVALVGAGVTAAVAWLAGQAGVTIPESWMPWVVLVVGGAFVEAIRRFVYSPNTVQKIADKATFQEAGTPVDIGNPPDASPPLPEGQS